MKIESKKEVYEGKVEKDPWGTWDDVDKGVFIDRDNINTILWDYRNKKIRLTIEVIED